MSFIEQFLLAGALSGVMCIQFGCVSESRTQVTGSEIHFDSGTLFKVKSDAESKSEAGFSDIQFMKSDGISAVLGNIASTDTSVDDSISDYKSMPMPSHCLVYPKTANGQEVDLSKCTHAGLPILFRGLVTFGDGKHVVNATLTVKFKLGVFGWFASSSNATYNFQAFGTYTTSINTDKNGHYETTFSMSHPTWVGPEGLNYKAVCPGKLSHLEVIGQMKSEIPLCKAFCDGQLIYQSSGGTPGYEVPNSKIQAQEVESRECQDVCKVNPEPFNSSVQFPLMNSDGNCFAKPDEFPFGVVDVNFYLIKQEQSKNAKQPVGLPSGSTPSKP